MTLKFLIVYRMEPFTAMESAGLEPGRQGAWGGERVRKTVNSSLLCCLGLAGMYPEAPLCTRRKLRLNFVPLVPLGTSSQISPQVTSPNYYMYIYIIYIYIYIFIFDCTGYLLLSTGFLEL